MPCDLRHRCDQVPEIIEVETDDVVSPEEIDRALHLIAYILARRCAEKLTVGQRP